VWNGNGIDDFYELEFGSPLGASGGGCSTVFAAQGWQIALSNWADTDCGTKRLDADIAADADPLTGVDIFDSFKCGADCPSPGWLTVGGTSLSSPTIAALYALAGGAQGINYPALTLYDHLGSSSLYNVTIGGNGWCDGEGAAACGDPNKQGDGIVDCDYTASGTLATGTLACDAAPGFNGPSGVGTPNGLGAFVRVSPAITIKGPTSVVKGDTNTWTATVTDPSPGGKVTSFSWKWGDGTAAATTTTGSATHAYAAAGTFTITLTVTDNYGVTSTKTYSVTVTT